MAQNYMNISKESYNLLINIRDFISIIAIIAIIPILANRISILMTPEDTHNKIDQTKKELRAKRDEIDNIESQMRQAEKLDNATQYRELADQLNSLRTERDNIDQNLEELRKQRLSYFFYASILIGVSSLLVGVFIPLIHAGLGFLIGGLFTIGYGYWIFWDQLSNLIATISLIVALVGLVAGMLLYRPRSS